MPVVAATYGYSIVHKDGRVALLGLAAVFLFALLDANYLRQEQAFRRLYDAVARRMAMPAFTLNPADAVDATQQTPGRARAIVGRWLPGPRVWLSWSIAPLYGGLLVVGALIAIAA